MGKYENGMSTKKIILTASRRLFLEKGFHETSSEDICRAAHVNRTAIHYHFKDKENLRYEILWEFFMEYKSIAAGYCPEEDLQLTLALYLSWCHIANSPVFRKFYVDYSKDYPIYIPQQPLPTYYRILYRHMFESIWPMENISSLNFSAIYGHLMSVSQLVDTQPERYHGRELFLHGMKACLQSWEIPPEKATHFWKRMITYMDVLPDTIIEELPKS